MRERQMSFCARKQTASFHRVLSQWGSSLDYRAPLYSDDRTSTPTLRKLLSNDSEEDIKTRKLTHRPTSARPRADPTQKISTTLSRGNSIKENNPIPPQRPLSPEQSVENTVKEANPKTVFVVEGSATLKKELSFVKAQLADKEAKHQVTLQDISAKNKELEQELLLLKENVAADEKRLKKETMRLSQELVIVEDALRKERKDREEQERETGKLRSSESFAQATNSVLKENLAKLHTQVGELESKYSCSELALEEKSNQLVATQEEAANEIRGWKEKCAKLMAHLQWNGTPVDKCDDVIEILEEYRRKQTPTLVAHLASRTQAGEALKTEAVAWESAYKGLQCQMDDCNRRADERVEWAERARRTAEARVEDAEKTCRLAEERAKAAEDRSTHAEFKARRMEDRARASAAAVCEKEREADIRIQEAEKVALRKERESIERLREAEEALIRREREAQERLHEAQMSAAQREREAANREREVLESAKEQALLFEKREPIHSGLPPRPPISSQKYNSWMHDEDEYPGFFTVLSTTSESEFNDTLSSVDAFKLARP